MGTFISLSGIIGATKEQVENSLRNYAQSVSGNLQEKIILDQYSENCCVINETDGNTTINFPNHYAEWDKTSEFISRDLNKPVFSCHIHDSDLWMYILYSNGKIVDRFNPIPEYWEELDEAEIKKWKGNSATILKYCPYINEKEIEKYLVTWDLENENEDQAYPDDEYYFEDWQLLDFLRKLKIPTSPDDNNNLVGKTFLLWTQELPLENKLNKNSANMNEQTKPWWKFW
jgi:hypothetical protein